MRLDDRDLARHDPLARALLLRLRAVLPAGAFEEIAAAPSGHDPVLVVRIPAASPAVGDVTLHSDGTELTRCVGDHTHDHHGTYLYGKSGDPAAVERAAAVEADWLRDLLGDRIVVWSRRDADGRVGAGGTASIADSASIELRLARRIATEAWLWSGRPYPLGRAAGSPPRERRG